jgi:3-deoxy-7-phosphoheptulonate synthase/chorismate mutase
VNAQNIEELRLQVDEINNKLLALLNERASLVRKIGEFKVKNGLPIYDPAREQQIISYLLQQNRGPLDDSTVEALFKKIFDTSTELQQQQK